MIFEQSTIPTHLQFILGVVVVIFVMFLNKKVRKSHISVKSLIVWYIIAFASIAVVIFPGVLEALKGITGIVTTTSMLLFAGFTTLAFLSVYQSVKIERLEQKNKQLVQEFGILRKEIEDLKK